MAVVDKKADRMGLAPWSGVTKVTRVEYNIDFSATGYSLDQNDVLVIESGLALGTAIFGAIIEVTTAQADITDVDVGLDTNDPHQTSNILIDGASLASTGWVGNGSMDATPTYVTTAGTGLVFTDIDANTLDTAVIVLHLFVVNP